MKQTLLHTLSFFIFFSFFQNSSFAQSETLIVDNHFETATNSKEEKSLKKDFFSKPKDEEIKYRNILKLSFPVIAFERILSEKRSLNFHLLYFKYSWTYDDFVPIQLEELYNMSQTRLFALTTEYRFYLGKKPIPRGWYFGPYLRFGTYEVNGSEGVDDGIRKDIHGWIETNTTIIGAGAKLGLQGTIGKRITIDAGIGGGYNYTKVNFLARFDDQDIDLDGAVTNLNNLIADPDEGPHLFRKLFDFRREGESIVSNKPSSLPAIRMNLTIGLRF